MELEQTILALELETASLDANADMHAVEPTHLTSLPGHGFSLWYQDEDGTILNACILNASNPGTIAQHTIQ